MTWSEGLLNTLKENDVRLVTYVPDNVLTPLIKGVTEDNCFISVCATREDEAVGMVTGAWMAGMRGCVMMQTSGFGTLPNAIASLLVPTTGKQPTTTADVGDIVEIARGCGLQNSHWIRDENHFDELIDRSFVDGGPTLLAAKIDDQPGMSKMVRDPALIRNRFMKGLGTSRGGALDN